MEKSVINIQKQTIFKSKKDLKILFIVEIGQNGSVKKVL